MWTITSRPEGDWLIPQEASGSRYSLPGEAAFSIEGHFSYSFPDECLSYRYYYLKYREGGESVSRHVPAPQLDALKNDLDKRRDIGKEIKAYRDRIKYLEKILGLKP